jgi:type II secretory pathway component PulF
LVLLRIARFHGKPIRETLREGLRASWRQSRRAWLVNAVLTVAILVGEIVAVPHYEYLFKDFGGQLPTPTQAVIDDCNFLQSYLLLVPFMLAGLHFLYVWWEGLTRAGARVGGDIRLFRWLVWIGFGLYPVLIMVALYLPIWSLRGALR